MKLWIDDWRKPPSDEWHWVQTSQQAIAYLSHFGTMIELVSFDHDLGEDDTAMKVVDYIDRASEYRAPPRFEVHSQNPVGAANIRSAMQRITERFERKS